MVTLDFEHAQFLLHFTVILQSCIFEESALLIQLKGHAVLLVTCLQVIQNNRMSGFTILELWKAVKSELEFVFCSINMNGSRWNATCSVTAPLPGHIQQSSPVENLRKSTKLSVFLCCLLLIQGKCACLFFSLFSFAQKSCDVL